MLTQRLLLICYVSPTVAQFVAEQLLQNLKALTEFAKTGRFSQFIVRIRRLLARLTHRLGKNADLVKIERLLQRAVREAAKKPAATQSGEVRSMIKGVAEDGRKIYESNFPKGTPKKAKSERILDYIQNVWSKKPIPLVISNGEKSRTIYAKFDPTIDETKNTPTDASKLAGGNRHGNHTEQRVTLDLADDYYEIASEAVYNYSKRETGKDLETHDDVVMWHYFVNEIYFSEYGEEELVPYTVTINVKEKTDGEYVYSFNAEKEFSTQRTLHAAVNAEKGANGELFFNTIIHDSFEKNNPQSKSSIPFGFSMGAPQTAPTRTSRFTRASVDEQAKQLMRDAGAKGDRAEFTRILENFYEYVAQGQELSWDSITDATSPVVDWLTEHHATRNAVDAEAAENFYRKTKVY